MAKISVIVPVYNVEQYLTECMDSILGQTFSDIEIICIDDGSTDSSGRILDDYAQKDSRIIVIHKENAGYGVAMNKGLDIATGEYIGIVESDDKITADMFGKLYEDAKANDLDFVKSEAFFWYETIDYTKRVHDSSLEQYFDKVLCDDERNIFFDFFMNIWTGIYKKAFLDSNNIRFNETPGASYQDNGFWMLTCCCAQRVMWQNKAYYYYRMDNPNASVKSKAKMLAMAGEYDYVEEELLKRNLKECLPYCYLMRMIRQKSVYFRVADDLKLQFTEYLREDYKKYKAYIKGERYFDNFFRECIDDPDAFYNNVIAKKAKVTEKITDSEGMILYGIGKYGDIAIRNLYNAQLYDYVSCLATTGKTGCERMADREVLCIDEAVKQYPGATIMIAVAPGTAARKEMEDTLSSLNVGRFFGVENLFDCFYTM